MQIEHILNDKINGNDGMDGNKSETETDRTRFEFRRSKGDTIAFHEFWNEIEQIIYSQVVNVDGPKTKNDGFGGLPPLEPLDYNFNLNGNE